MVNYTAISTIPISSTILKDPLRDRNERIQKFYDPFSNDEYVHVAILMGLIQPGSKMGIREGLYSGGPLGEMIQWADIIAALNSFQNKNWDLN